MMQPVGRNTLVLMVETMFSNWYNRNSFQPTGATRLFEANIPGKLIQEKDRAQNHRHPSKVYECTFVIQQRAVSSVNPPRIPSGIGCHLS